MIDIILSPKYKYFLKYNKADVEILEGTTAAGKTTIGLIKWMLRVAESSKKNHFIAKDTVGEVLSKLVNKELGIAEVFNGFVEINPNGKDTEKDPHIVYNSPNGKKVIYLYGYADKERWKKVLGGQYGCGYIDEINNAKMNFVNQAMMRCDYIMGTLNPDDPDKDIYKEFINRCRPAEKYRYDAPDELLKCLNEPAEDRWIWWYFNFDDNYGLTEEKKQKILKTYTPGSVDHKHYILGLRGKAQGVIFDNFSIKTHTITEAEMLKMVKTKSKNEEHFIQFTAGLDTSYSSNSEDTISMTFLGITNKQRLIYMDELVLNNKGTKIPFAPSDIVIKFVEFLEKNRVKYGFAKDVFIDSADQATLTEAKKYRAKHGCIYNFISAHKIKIIDRINLQKGWIATGCYLVCNLCKEHIRELQVYSWSEGENEAVPEDANNHTIDSQCYAWIPYKFKIG